MLKCIVVIPAFNEEKNIAEIVSGIKSLNMDLDILVINDGSKDKTEKEALKAGAKVISLPFNLGYGGALQTGFKYSRDSGYDYLIQFDGDGQHDKEDIKIILDKLRNENMDIVIGSRFLGRGNFKVGFMKKLAILIFRRIIKISTGQKITDPTSGLQGLSRSAFSYYATMGNFPCDFPDADILIQMLRSNFTVTEFPANIKYRNNGVSMHSGLKPIIYFLKILISILVVLLREKEVKEGTGI